eukprot:4896257-Pleurochrysis_carterae.AAC.2
MSPYTIAHTLSVLSCVGYVGSQLIVIVHPTRRRPDSDSRAPDRRSPARAHAHGRSANLPIVPKDGTRKFRTGKKESKQNKRHLALKHVLIGTTMGVKAASEQSIRSACRDARQYDAIRSKQTNATPDEATRFVNHCEWNCDHAGQESQKRVGSVKFFTRAFFFQFCAKLIETSDGSAPTGPLNASWRWLTQSSSSCRRSSRAAARASVALAQRKGSTTREQNSRSENSKTQVQADTASTGERVDRGIGIVRA